MDRGKKLKFQKVRDRGGGVEASTQATQRAEGGETNRKRQKRDLKRKKSELKQRTQRHPVSTDAVPVLVPD